MKRSPDSARLRVEVGASDIVAGEPGNPEACPIALATLRATGALRVEVDPVAAPDCILIHWEDRDGRARMSKTARDFAEDFDGPTMKVKPTVMEFYVTTSSPLFYTTLAT